MSFSRYFSRKIFLNKDEEYRKAFFKERGIKQIHQYGIARLGYPSAEQLASFDAVPHLWAATDKLYNIAKDYYQDPTLWWVIAWFNAKPTEAHFEVGEVIYIPLPLDKVLAFF